MENKIKNINRMKYNVFREPEQWSPITKPPLCVCLSDVGCISETLMGRQSNVSLSVCIYIAAITTYQ